MTFSRENNFFFEAKRLWKPFVLIFALSWLVVNWNDISWVFNYKVARQYLSGVLENGPAAETEMEPEENRTEEENESKPGPPDEKTEPEIQNKPNSINIPKIGITAPIVEVASNDADVIYKTLDSGVVHFPASAGFGEAGQTVLLGHSAPPGWPNIKYDWVFTKINELEAGDTVSVFYQKKEYVYTVSKTYFLYKGEDIPANGMKDKNLLYLVSCWPPGKDYKRIAVEALLNP